MTVAENVFLGREPLSVPVLGLVDYARMAEMTREVFAQLDVQIDPHALVKDLGVAQQQMVEIAKALSIDARLVMMDEPTAALTSHEIERLFETIQRLRARGVSIVYISHRLDEVKAMADRATILRDGTFVATVSVADTSIDDMIRLMVGRDLKDQFPKVPVAPEAKRNSAAVVSSSPLSSARASGSNSPSPCQDRAATGRAPPRPRPGPPASRR